MLIINDDSKCLECDMKLCKHDLRVTTAAGAAGPRQFHLAPFRHLILNYGLTPRAFEDLSLLYEDCTGSDGTFTPSKASSSASTNQKRNCPRTIHLFLQLKPCYRMMANPKLPRLSATNADVRKPDPRYNVTNTIQTGKSAGNVVDLKVDSSSGMIRNATYLITSGAGLDSHHSGHPKPFKYSIKPRSVKAVVLIEQNVND
ncbi:hypothetical protein EV424DRAFT_1560384 [Suillus variegatus]|nr:hypothetical protein EV424DRAFT_1560384 [Suillus variegatus]